MVHRYDRSLETDCGHLQGGILVAVGSTLAMRSALRNHHPPAPRTISAAAQTELGIKVLATKPPKVICHMPWFSWPPGLAEITQLLHATTSEFGSPSVGLAFPPAVIMTLLREHPVPPYPCTFLRTDAHFWLSSS